MQSESRTEQQTQEWLSRYALRAAIESRISEFVNGHGMRQCRYRSEDKAHVQHVLNRHRSQPRTHRRPPAAHTRPPAQKPNRAPGLPRLAAHPPAAVLARRHPPRGLR
ncbi:transposase [Streptomyces sp. NPDC002328]|uniref:transposase n=1 Tax=Streptomyces sp. NPDC002328 TaxID=3364642 RepID=UPI0036D0C6A2